MLRFHLLGQFRILDALQPLKFAAPPKALPLLAYLLLHSDQPVARETLAFTLWPDDTEANARANLRRHLHHLARALPPPREDAPWLVLDTDTAQWNPGADYWADAVEFQRLSARADGLPDAVALYSGDLLENVYDDWLFYPREQLRTLFVTDLQELILRRRADRDYVRALEYGCRLLAHEPLREDTVRQLMSLRYETGDRAGALCEYQQFARRLRHELAAEPMPETTALYESIVRNARLPTEIPAIPVAAAAQATRISLPFAGRLSEMEQLRSAWNHAANKQGGMVLISGEAGIGKTRLVSELALVVESQGGRVLWGNAVAESAPYQAIISALRSALPLVASLEIEPLWLAAVSALLPELRVRLPKLPPLMPLDPQRERSRLFESLDRCLEALAQPRPVLLLLDDLHWAGAVTLAWLEYLAAGLSRLPVLVVGTYREEEAAGDHPLHAMRRRLERAGLASHLAVGRLDVESVQQLAERVCADMPPALRTEILGQALWTASEGNPFFIHELIRDWIELGRPIAETRAPSSVPATLAARLARLSPSTRTLGEIASVVGVSFDTDMVRRAAGWSEAQTLEALNELLDHQLVREAGGRNRFDLAFTHHLIQSALYAGIPEQARMRRHRRVAHVMEQIPALQGDELAGEIARHWDQGGDKGHAVEQYLRAASHALSMYAETEAFTHIQRALDLGARPPTHMALLKLRETVYARRGERSVQYADLKQLRELALASGDEDEICDSLVREIHYHRTLGDRQSEAALIDSLGKRAAASGLARWQAEALCQQATLQISVSDYDAASPNVQRALDIYQILDDIAGQVRCLCLCVEIGIWQGHFGIVQISLERAGALTQSHANQSLLVQTLRAASAAAFAKQDFQVATDLGTRMLELCRRIGDLEGEADALTRLGTIESRLFQIQAARERYRQAASLYERLGKRQGQAAVLLNAGLLAGNRLGRYAEALKQFRQAESLFVELNDLRGQMVSALNIGMTAFFSGNWAEAKTAAERGLTLARQMSSPVMEANALANLGAAERELGEVDQAIEHMQAGLAIRRSLGQPSDLGTDLCDLALAFLGAGKTDQACQAAKEMLDLYSKAPELMVRAEYMLWVASQTYDALGDKVRAHELLTEAYSTLQSKAAAIPDEESRTSFLAYSFNRQIACAFDQKGH